MNIKKTVQLKYFQHTAIFLLMLCFQPVSALTFSADQQHATGTITHSIVSDDFNVDGTIDIAGAQSFPAAMSVILSDGAGSYSAKTDYLTGILAYGSTTGDFDGINGPDLAITDSLSNTVSVLLNNGDGTFAAKVDYAAGSGALSVTSGDFDGINGLDLAVINSSANNVSIYLNNGDGSYAARVNYSTGVYPHAVISKDFDGINGPDLAIANRTSNTASVLLNNGDGTFAAKADYATGSSLSYAIESSDFDGINGPDLVVANRTSHNISVFLNNGDGSYAPKVNYATSNGPQSIAIGDFDRVNGDDIAVVSNQSNVVSIFLNNGDGTYAAKVDFAAGVTPAAITSADFNGDSFIDYAVTNTNNNTVTIYLNVVDTTPDAFSFTDQTDVALSSLTTSNTLAITGLEASTAISITGGEYSINGGTFTTSSGTVSNNDTVAVRHTSSASYFTTIDTTVSIGGISDTFRTTTITDTVPDAFSFTDQSNVAVNSQVTSNTLTITGLGATASISITDGEYSINSGAFTSLAGLINNNDTLSVRHSSAGSKADTTDTVVSIGGISDTFSTTTLAEHIDTTPNAFSFFDQFDVELNTVIVSNTQVISGIASSTVISVTNGEYSINGSSFYGSSRASTVYNGDRIIIRHKSSIGHNASTDTVVTIGTISDTFTSTTRIIDIIPDDFSFKDQIGVALSAQVTSNTLAITGLESATAISIKYGEYSINSGVFTSSVGTVSDHDMIVLRHTSSNNHSSKTKTVVTIGPISRTFTSTTMISEIISDTDPEVIPDPIHNTVPITIPDVTPGHIPDTVPVLILEDISEPIPDTVLETTPEILVNITPETKPVASGNGGGTIGIWGLSVLMLIRLIKNSNGKY